jgi:hypothetical protein
MHGPMNVKKVYKDVGIIAFISVDIKKNTIFGLYIHVSEKRCGSELILLVEKGIYAEYID